MQLTIRPGTVQLILSPAELERLSQDAHIELPLGSGDDRIVIAVDVRQAGRAVHKTAVSTEQMSIENAPAVEH